MNKKILVAAIASMGLTACAGFAPHSEYDEFKGSWSHESSSNREINTLATIVGVTNKSGAQHSWVMFELTSYDTFRASYAYDKNGNEYKASSSTYDLDCDNGCRWTTWGNVSITNEQLKEQLSADGDVMLKVYGDGVPFKIQIKESQIEEFDKELLKGISERELSE